MSEDKLCYWCHEPLPPLPGDASYVDEINHYAHDECLEARDERNRRMDQLRAGIVDGSIDSIPDSIRQAVLDRIKTSGFSRRCPCLYDPAYGFQGYQSHSYSNGETEVDDYDERKREGLRPLLRVWELRPAAKASRADRRQSSRSMDR